MREFKPLNNEQLADLHSDESHLRTAIVDLENQTDADDELASTLNDLADCLLAQGRCDEEIVALYQRALDLFIDSGGLEQPDVANVLNNLAAIHYELSDYATAQTQAEQALAIMDGLFAQKELVAETDAETLALCAAIQLRALTQAATALRAQGCYTQAEPLLTRALTLATQDFGADSLETADSLNNLGVLYKYWGKYQQAETLYQQALAILKQHYGSEHFELAGIFYNLAGLRHARAEYAEAELLCRKALALQTAVLPDAHQQLAVTRGTLAAILDGQGRYDEALALYRKALATHVTRYGTEHPEVALNLNNLAVIAEAQGYFAEAEALYLQALHIRERCLGSEHPQVATSLNNLAMLYPSIGKGKEAKALFHRALQILEKTVGAEHPHTQICREHWQACSL